MKRRTKKPLVCSHCGTEISGGRYIEKESGVYMGEDCYFRDTYLDGIIESIEASYLATIEAFVSAIDAREHETGNHSARVSRLAVIIGHAYGITGRDLTDLYCGALLHDIGKIGIPDAILLKKGPLTPEERQLMEHHPEIGYGIISHIGYLAGSAEIIRSHHEHFDGSGYPLGLKGNDIPAGARVFAVADTLDALTVKRPYRDAIPYKEALTLIEKDPERLFDPGVIDAMRSSSEELEDFIGKLPSVV